MTENKYIPLKNRAIISLAGDDKNAFLQNIITNDINLVSEKNSIYSLLLTPQGKFLFDFFIAQKNDVFYIDCAEKYKDELIKKLKMYNLRSNVIITDISDNYEAVMLIGNKLFDDTELQNEVGSTRKFCKGIIYIDPRTTKLFARAIIEKNNEYQSFNCHDFTLGPEEKYQSLRIKNIIPDGEYDLISAKSFPLQFNMDNLNAISFTKGCYIGQEVTARTYHRGKVKKKIVLLESVSKTDPTPNQIIYFNEKPVGMTYSCHKKYSISLISSEIENNTCKNTIFNCEKFMLKYVDEDEI